MPRINDQMLDELIANEGYSSADSDTVNPTGVLRLALDLLEARRAPTPLPSHWTLEWPTEPGLYLFYGGFRGHGPEHDAMHLCHVFKNRNGIHRTLGNRFLYESEEQGAFKRLTEEPPDLEALHAAAAERG